MEQNDANGQYFVSEVYVCDELYGTGSGFSKRESQQKAAKMALESLNAKKWDELARKMSEPTSSEADVRADETSQLAPPQI